MTVLATIDDVAGERFVSLTTFRRDGTPVATPVWIARDGDALVVTRRRTAER
ncbi:PNPOx family protein [Pseudonocardia charpentierae]|uniref:Pyridoxamine 5'-phosphate oxidase family protein n=1 Tax=Pseudonocardia charpentierae TaxID=3075545 RepID=A0ABU2NG34_9PSEU|nr:pyridoxamine 5'-phosphate oxidase family protein [Pseudonocardia sp. DSM 45834]MDT0352926.1 pyridoxamine 5'-phosphate oxidase family protein [Pseudonocardia sp. DSM 45834]